MEALVWVAWEREADTLPHPDGSNHRAFLASLPVHHTLLPPQTLRRTPPHHLATLFSGDWQSREVLLLEVEVDEVAAETVVGVFVAGFVVVVVVVWHVEHVGYRT